MGDCLQLVVNNILNLWLSQVLVITLCLLVERSDIFIVGRISHVSHSSSLKRVGIAIYFGVHPPCSRKQMGR